MSDEAYEKLADALGRLPNGFPRTPSGVEIPLLRKMYRPDEARLASQLRREPEAPDVIAKRMEVALDEAATRLADMTARGLVWRVGGKEEPAYRLAPFIFGAYEAHLERMDHEFAHLFEEYMAEGGAAGIMAAQPPIFRVVPARSAVKSEWIVPYEDARGFLLNARSFRVRDCICRTQQGHIGRECSFPLKVCLSYDSRERPPTRYDISKKEALTILDRAEEIGLVHATSNAASGMGFLCNCCGCCCGILRAITTWGIEGSPARANYYSVIDPDRCSGCGTCIERCQVQALHDEGGVTVVDRERCIGCGLCVTGCPNDVARLDRKPDAEIVRPPADFAAWEQERLAERGLAE